MLVSQRNLSEIQAHEIDLADDAGIKQRALFELANEQAYRSLAIFAGFNHSRRVVIFGAALLYDETAESFEWLFREFLKAHKSKKPQTVFMDQEPHNG
jgi:hypothetical protein